MSVQVGIATMCQREAYHDLGPIEMREWPHQLQKPWLQHIDEEETEKPPNTRVQTNQLRTKQHDGSWLRKLKQMDQSEQGKRHDAGWLKRAVDEYIGPKETSSKPTCLGRTLISSRRRSRPRLRNNAESSGRTPTGAPVPSSTDAGQSLELWSFTMVCGVRRDYYLWSSSKALFPAILTCSSHTTIGH